MNSQFNDWSFGTKRSARSIAFATPAIQILYEHFTYECGIQLKWIVLLVTGST